MLVPGLSSAKRGVLVGQVKAIRNRRVIVAARRPVAAGDGVVFAGNRAEGDEQGGRVYSVTPRDGGDIELTFGHGAIRFSRLHPGQQIWKTDDPQLTAMLRKTFSGSKPQRRVALDLVVHAAIGERLRIIGQAANGASCVVESPVPLAEAIKHPLTQQVLVQQLGRLGGTVYELRELRAEIVGDPMAPLSVLGKLRHQMVEQLTHSGNARATRRTLKSDASQLAGSAPNALSKLIAPMLRVLCRTLEQLTAAAELGVSDLIADFQDIRAYRTAVDIAAKHDATLLIATPRIQKPGETGIFRTMARHGAAGFLVRNLAGMAFCDERGIPFVCDFSLNAANQWTVDYLLSRGARRVTVSYDLNRDQLLDLVDSVSPAWLEIVIHQHMPMFHMEHCVFCAVLSPGTNKHNCGRPCDVHAVKLRDRVGMEHVLHADVGCRNTLYNAVPQSAAEVVPTLLAKSLRNFRVELLSENTQEARHVIDLYDQLLVGRISGKQVWQRLRATNRVGVTRGTLEERRNPLAIL
jgi:putative protease